MGKGSKVTVVMDPCTRCTALIHGQQERCGLCGWPTGAPFPQVDAVEAPEVVVTEVPVAEDESTSAQAGEQLDALSAMVVRQQDVAEPVVSQPLVAADSPPVEAQASELAALETHESHDPPRASVPDPLTAPLDLVTSDIGLDDFGADSWPSDVIASMEQSVELASE